MKNKKWKHTIDLSEFYKNEELTIFEKGVLASKTINRLASRLDKSENNEELVEELRIIADDFATVSGSDEFTIEDDFNERMTELYDISDINNIWVSTF
jgi:hypothetical protein